MKILIDLQPAQTSFSKFRGVGRYSREITYSFIKNCTPQDEVYIMLNGYFIDSVEELKNYFSKIIPVDHIKVWNWYNPIPRIRDNVLKKIDQEIYFKKWFIDQFDVDIIWTPNFQEGPNDEGVITTIGSEFKNRKAICCCTLHDISPLIEKKLRPNIGIRNWYKEMIHYAKCCDAIFTVSEFSKNAISQHLNYEKNNIIIATPAANKKFFFQKENFDFSRKEKFFLYFGSNEEYKNVEYLIRAYSRLPSDIIRKYKLYLCGNDFIPNKKYYLKLANSLKIKNKVIIFNDTSDSAVAELMRKCSLFIFPSLCEGFGLPPLEAISCGALTLVSNRTSLPEVVGTSEATFDPTNINDLNNKIIKILNNKEYANQLFSKEFTNSKKFDWNYSAKTIYDFFKSKLLSKHKHITKKMSVENYVTNNIKDRDDNYIKTMSLSFSNSVVNFQTKRFFVDLTAVVTEDFVTGIQRVCNAITINLKNILNSKNIEVIPIYSLFGRNIFIKANYRDGRFKMQDTINSNNIVQFHDNDVILFADLDLSDLSRKGHYFKLLMNRGIKIYGILYDLIPVRYPKYAMSDEFTKYFYDYLFFLSKLDGISAISQAVLSDYKKWIKENNIKVKNNYLFEYFHLGSDIKKANPSKMTKSELKNKIKKTSKHTFLMVSTIEPRKMHSQVLKAFDILWKRGFDVQLIFAGRAGWKMEKFSKKLINISQKNNHFKWILSPSDEYLHHIYNIADAIIVASATEGFGLPIVEAAFYHKNVIVRDIPVFREISRNGAFYFNTFDPKKFSNNLLEWIKKFDNNQLPNVEDIETLTWSESSKLLLKSLKII